MRSVVGGRCRVFAVECTTPEASEGEVCSDANLVDTVRPAATGATRKRSTREADPATGAAHLAFNANVVLEQHAAD